MALPPRLPNRPESLQVYGSLEEMKMLPSPELHMRPTPRTPPSPFAVGGSYLVQPSPQILSVQTGWGSALIRSGFGGRAFIEDEWLLSPDSSTPLSPTSSVADGPIGGKRSDSHTLQPFETRDGIFVLNADDAGADLASNASTVFTILTILVPAHCY